MEHIFIHISISGRKADKGSKTGYAPTGYCDSKLMNALFTKELAVR